MLFFKLIMCFFIERNLLNFKIKRLQKIYFVKVQNSYRSLPLGRMCKREIFFWQYIDFLIKTKESTYNGVSSNHEGELGGNEQRLLWETIFINAYMGNCIKKRILDRSRQCGDNKTKLKKTALGAGT